MDDENYKKLTAIIRAVVDEQLPIPDYRKDTLIEALAVAIGGLSISFEMLSPKQAGAIAAALELERRRKADRDTKADGQKKTDEARPSLSATEKLAEVRKNAARRKAKSRALMKGLSI